MYMHKPDSLCIGCLAHTPLKDAKGGRESSAFSLKTCFLCTALLAHVFIQGHRSMPDAPGEIIDLHNHLLRMEPDAALLWS